MKSLALAILAFLVTANGALAFWDIQASGEDVFGNVNVTVSGMGDNGNIVRFECGSQSEPRLAYLIRDTSGQIPDWPALFVHQDGASQRHETPALLTSWNDTYVAVQVTDEATLRRIAEHMLVASRPIAVGILVQDLDIRRADTFTSRGSTQAGQTILDNCFK